MAASGNSEVSVDEVIEATAVPILEFGRGWMMDPETASRAAELGLEKGFSFWVNGRAGVLADADADVAAAAIGFMAPDSVREYWEGRPAGLSGPRAAAAYADAAAAWGRRVLADVDDAATERLADLCDKVAAAALASTGVLFAGWRAMARPDDGPGRATVALNVLRELRGGAHLSAVQAVGLGPHGAIMSADDPVRGGAAGAERFGWPAPHPPADAASRREAERLTSGICRPGYGALEASERVEFVDLVTLVRAKLD